MKFSRESYYGLKILTHMARTPGRVSEASDVAAAARVPRAFAAKILQKLARAGIVRSHRGRTRGYALIGSAGSVSVREVVEAIDGSDVFRRCVFWTNRCSDSKPCPLHDLWKQVRPEVASAMSRVTVAELTRGARRSKTYAGAGGRR